VTAVLSLSFFALVNFFPWRAIDKYHHYLGMRPDIRNLSEKNDFGKSLVLIRGDAHPDYASAAVYNPVDLRDSVPLYAWYRNPQTLHKLRSVYSERTVWTVNGPSITKKGFEIVENPFGSHHTLRTKVD
jgi:hypothetical protein